MSTTRNPNRKTGRKSPIETMLRVHETGKGSKFAKRHEKNVKRAQKRSDKLGAKLARLQAKKERLDRRIRKASSKHMEAVVRVTQLTMVGGVK